MANYIVLCNRLATILGVIEEGHRRESCALNNKGFKKVFFLVMLHFFNFFHPILFLKVQFLHNIFAMRVIAISFLHAEILWYTLSVKRWSVRNTDVVKILHSLFFCLILSPGFPTGLLCYLRASQLVDCEHCVEILISGPSDWQGREDKSED